LRHRTDMVFHEAPSGALRRSRGKTLWFCVPAHGREALTAICLRQLRRTCDALTAEHIEASAVVVADDGNLDTARDLGFATVRRNNEFLSRKFNDGIQLALDSRFNPRPADYVVPCGSDDWVDHRLFLNGLPEPGQMLAFRMAAFVSEDGRQIVSRVLDYEGGVGIRVYPRAMLEHLRFRPADEDRKRACDTSILANVKRELRALSIPPPQVVYGDLHPFQIVDWKSASEQLNSFSDITIRHRRGTPPVDPFDELAKSFPKAALREMRAHYARARDLVAA